MKYLWSDAKRLKKIFHLEKTKLIFLDFDGTLVPIAPTPDAVCFDDKTKEILRCLCGNRRIHLVVISGRTLKDLGSYLRFKNVILAGNHGLEVKGRGIQLPPKARQARKLRHFIGMLSKKFKIAFNDYPGVWVEDKHFTLSIHFRKLPREQELIFKALVRFFKDKYKHYPILWTLGKKVVEIRPSVYWGKGDTVMYLLKKFSRAIALAIGDDQADEDMFRVLKANNGITIRVGSSNQSLADYYLSSPYDVKIFLQKLCA
jgi:trehalose-phosphatase